MPKLSREDLFLILERQHHRVRYGHDLASSTSVLLYDLRDAKRASLRCRLHRPFAASLTSFACPITSVIL